MKGDAGTTAATSAATKEGVEKEDVSDRMMEATTAAASETSTSGRKIVEPGCLAGVGSSRAEAVKEAVSRAEGSKEAVIKV